MMADRLPAGQTLMHGQGGVSLEGRAPIGHGAPSACPDKGSRVGASENPSIWVDCSRACRPGPGRPGTGAGRPCSTALVGCDAFSAMNATPDSVSRDRYFAYLGQGPSQVPHFEHWSCPDAETYLTGIDYYEHPRACRQRLQELYPELGIPVPESDAPVPRPTEHPAGDLASHTVRWGAGESWQFDWGRNFQSAEEALAFSPLEQGDFREIPVVESFDYRDEDALFAMFRSRYPLEWGDQPPEGREAVAGFYNTMFMWPLLTFGWERFLEISLEPGFSRLMAEFAEINRRVFRCLARLPVHVVICHDDIVTTRGPVCSPQWMAEHIFPRYEEFFGMLRGAGKRVLFMADGNMDAYIDDVMACGACGVVTEPYTDFRAIARKHPDCVIAGEGDNRVLSRRDPDEISDMVDRMVETSRMTGGYFMCIGNHIPWDIPPESVKLYLDLSRDRARR